MQAFIHPRPDKRRQLMKELIRKGLVVEKPAVAKAPVWREPREGRPLMAIISDDGLTAIGMLPVGEAGRRSRAARKKATVADTQEVVAILSSNEPRRPRAGSKLAMLVALLEREAGASIEQMAEATGWRQHSVRGVLSGTLVKKFSLTVASEMIEGRDRTYRLRH